MRSTGSASLTGVEVTAEERTVAGAIEIIKRSNLGAAFLGDNLGDSQSAFTKIRTLTRIFCRFRLPWLFDGGGCSL